MPNSKGESIIPVTTYVRPYDLAPHEFMDARTGKLHTEHTLCWKMPDKTVEEYLNHPENKFENGHRSGVMRRRHFAVDSVVYIGKESNQLEEIAIHGMDSENLRNVSKTYLEQSK